MKLAFDYSCIMLAVFLLGALFIELISSILHNTSRVVIVASTVLQSTEDRPLQVCATYLGPAYTAINLCPQSCTGYRFAGH